MNIITEISTKLSDDKNKFNKALLFLLTTVAHDPKLTKLNHLTFSTTHASFNRVDDKMGKEIVQLITQITTNTSIKSLFIDPLWLKPEYNQFLRMWYRDPFGNCNIPNVLDLNWSRAKVSPRIQRMIRYTAESVYVAQICDK